MTYYEALGFAEPRLSLDADDLKKRFYERSRQWHPDRYSRADAAVQQKALDMTAMLNDAFRTLRDPVSRAEYFLKSNGIELSKEAPPELLEEVFDLNMALEELRGGDEAARPHLDQARARFQTMRAGIDEALARMFAEYDRSCEAPVLDRIRGTLNRRRYVSNLMREVEKELTAD